MQNKNKTKIILIIILLVFIVLIAMIYGAIKYYTTQTLTAVIVKVNENSLGVMGIKNEEGIISVGFGNEGNIGFKEGQEILIYYDGYMLTTYPPQVGKVKKIKILKEESDITIPDDILRYFYSSYNNVNVNVSDITSKGLIINIEDSNELPYDYSNMKYSINKKIKNEDYTGVGYKIGEDTENSIAGYTRDRS